MITLDWVNHNTRWKQDRFETCLKIANDPDSARRRKKQICVICFYGSSIAGCAFTDKNCENCGIEMGFSDTDVDKLCMDCSTKLKLCKHCASDIELKKRKKL